jgi:hypothetical protein
MRARAAALSVAALCVVAGIGSGDAGAQYQWDLPPRVAPPALPRGVTMTRARVELGR